MSADSSRAIPNTLTIAGMDPSGGAGILADVKAMSALGAYACAVVAALTAQNTQAVTDISPVNPQFVRAQIDTLFADVEIHAAKIGMLGQTGVIEVVADRLGHHRPAHLVLDPVMVAKSGDLLLEQKAVGALREQLLPLATVITPNLDEAALLLERSIQGVDDLSAAAHALLAQGAQAVLLKGGHLVGDEVVDLLVQANGPSQRLASQRIASRNVHGTGCTLSSAIAAHLALGHGLSDAVRLARTFILGAIAQGAEVHTGQGHGPLNHGFAPVPLHRITNPPSTVKT